jgi:PAS domain S-box-containing protein
MAEPRVQPDEAERLASLDALDLLDTPGEPRFDRITRIAQRHFGVHIALVSLVGADRVWFKSMQGIEVCVTQRAASFCERAIRSEGVFCVPDAVADPRFAGNPMVAGPPHIRFYAGAPLHAPGGQRIGTLCIMDDQPRAMTGADNDMLLDLAAVVDGEISKGILVVQGQALTMARRLEDVITRAQSEFIAAEDRSGAFQGLLDDLLALTDSQYGFIGEVLHTSDGAPYLKTYAITDISWDAATQGFYEREAPHGMEFGNLGTLFGGVLGGGGPVIANDPLSDPRRGGLPPGHPPLDSFLGVPVFHADDMVAMFGLANRPGGYDPSVIDFLRPLTATLGQLVYAARIRALHVKGERRLRFIIDGTRIGTWEWNVQTGETEFNERWAEIVGYTLAELAPVSIQTWLDLAHPDDLKACTALLESHFRGETEYYDCHCRMRHKDGRWVWIHDRGRVMKWTEDGKPLLLSGTHVDVTAEKEAQLELEVSQTRLRGLFELSPVGIALTGFETGAYIEVNDALLASTGYSRDEFLRLRYFDITPPEYAAQDRRKLETLRTAGRYSGHEKEYIRKDGTRFPVLLNGMLVRDSAGRRLIWSIIEDISEQKALLQQAERQRDSLHSLLDQLQIGTLLLESDGCVGFASRYCSSLGLDPQAAVGRQWTEVLPLRASERSSLGQQLRAAREERQPVELSWRRGNREFFIECEIRDAPIDALGRDILCLKDVSEIRLLQRQLIGTHCGSMLGNSEPMRELYRRIGDVARGDWTVLIEGETGVGKELVARSIHESSARRDGPFVAVNSAGLSEDLLHSQLFGHRKGAFTGAVADQQGFFETAAGGTLFLDEIGDLPLGMQSSLLRVLQEKEIVRLGETVPRAIDVRILAATNKDLAAEVAAGHFRQDLFYRVRVARLHVPPLRERSEDIPLLVASFLELALPASGEAPPRCDSEAMKCLMRYPWPGNVRELKSTIDHAVIYRRGDVIRCADLPEEIACGPGAQHAVSPEGDEHARILAALERTGGNCSTAAALLGMSRTTLYRHMARLGITPHPDRKDPPIQP